MLKEMDIFVRSHLSPLRPEQVALMRARWERDKRKQKQPAALPKRRRAAKVGGPGAPVGGAPPTPFAPRAFLPTPVRPKPVASAIPGGTVPPRPVASAAPGAIPLEERRREKGKKRKKGKKSLVDQEAVAQNISRTLASIKGPVGKRGVHRPGRGPRVPAPQGAKRGRGEGGG